MTTRQTRYEQVSRRAFLRRSAAVSAVILFPGLAACSGGSSGATSSTLTTLLGTTTTATAATSTTAATTTTTPTSSSVVVADAFLPTGSEVLVGFSYAAVESGEKINNPYVAVWIEDADGELIKTLALWYKQTDKGSEWLADLIRWNRIDGSNNSILRLSGSTRTPGEYTLVWDGSDLAGDPVKQGTYFVCVESAREHGPYSLIRTPVVIGSEPFTMALESDGELVAASVTMVVA